MDSQIVLSHLSSLFLFHFSSTDVNHFLSDEMVISSNKYEVENTVISSFESRMGLMVRKLTASDVGGYRCVAKNSLGEVDSVIRLYGNNSLYIMTKWT